MAKKTLAETLGLNEKRGPLPPKYVPKLRIRVTNDRTKQVSEFDVDLPIDGFIADIYPTFQKLRAVLETHGLMPKVLTAETANGQEKESPEENSSAQAS